MGGVLGWLSGANTDPNSVASNVGNYYNNAATSAQTAYANAAPTISSAYSGAIPGIDASYQNAENQLSGNLPAAATSYGALLQEGLQPQFTQQLNALPGALAAAGLTGSGAGAQQVGNVLGQQSSAFASGLAPLYSNAESQYAGLLSGNAGADTSIYGQQAGALAGNAENSAGAASGIYGSGAAAQGNAYSQTNANNLTSFYNALSTGAAAAGYGTGAQTPLASGQTSAYTPAQQAQLNAYNPYSVTDPQIQQPNVAVQPNGQTIGGPNDPQLLDQPSVYAGQPSYQPNNSAGSSTFAPGGSGSQFNPYA